MTLPLDTTFNDPPVIPYAPPIKILDTFTGGPVVPLGVVTVIPRTLLVGNNLQQFTTLPTSGPHTPSYGASGLVLTP